MSPGEREARRAMVKAGWLPGHCCMADGAVRRKVRKHMLRTYHIIVVGLMAGDALGWSALVAIVLVALRAQHGGMCSCQWELRL